MTTLGARLKHLREKAGLTREKAAADLELSYWTLAKYEIDERSPDNNTLKKLADYFGTTTDYLLGRTEDPGTPDQPDLETLMYLRLEKSKLSKATKKQFMRAFRENLELIKQLEDEMD